MSDLSASPRPRRRGLLLLFVVLLGLVAAGGIWLALRPKPAPSSQGDPVAAIQANTRGVGKMEQFDFDAAAKDFDEASRLDPNWLPAQINLGIALLNASTPESLARARTVLNEVLAKDPKNPHALYSLGIINLYENHIAEAYHCFEAVSRIDPNDAYTWFHMGVTNPAGRDSPTAKQCYEKALQLNPYLNAARYALAQHPHEYDAEKSKRLLAEHKALIEAKWESEYRIAYTEMGHYAEVLGRVAASGPPAIGPLPMFERDQSFRVKLAEGARWSKGASNPLLQAIVQRFGRTMVLLDYNHDGRPDIFLLNAVDDKGQLRNLLLRNDGAGQFTDVTSESGLAEVRTSLSCSVADFDNDGFPDLFLGGVDQHHLFRNTGTGKFEEVTTKAGLDKVNGVVLGASWADVDQDGDLDLLLSFYGETETALQQLASAQPGTGQLLLWLNTGEARPVKPGDTAPPLTCRFQRHDLDAPRGAMVNLALSDVDGDRDLDLLLFADNAAPTTLFNDRLLRFHAVKDRPVAEAARWNGALVLDVNHDDLSDLLLLRADQPPLLCLNQSKPGEGMNFTAKAINGTPLLQAQAIDLDLDGWTDVVGLTQDHQPILLHNEGQGHLAPSRGAFGQEGAKVSAVALADFTDDANPDLLLWEEQDGGLRLLRNLGNGHRALRLELSGRRDARTNLRTNADGIGTWLAAQTGTFWTALENTTLAAGLGQSRLPLLLGMGANSQAEILHIRWPDRVPQAELNLATDRLVRITEIDRKGTSCPVLLAWDGSRYRVITDFFGANALGEMRADGSSSLPRDQESIKIEAEELALRQGEYLLKITEPMDEMVYLDHLRLLVLDHPADVSVYPDERFAVDGPMPTQELLAFRQRIFPRKARNHNGREVTALLAERDRRFVDDFAHRSWLGLAEEHYVDLDFAEQLSHFKPSDRLVLVLAGWADYAYPEALFAANQAGFSMLMPQLERQEGDRWKSLGELGFPAGLPRVMTREITGLVQGPRCVLRLRTNLQVYWDQVYIVPLVSTREDTLRVTPLEVKTATLAARGFMQEITPQGRGPVSYDPERTEPVAITRWKGMFTRYGEVTELLRARDDRHVLCGPGDEITVHFDATTLPSLPPGWKRSFVLRAWGWGKDIGPFTATGGEVDPLPTQAMKQYPYQPVPSALEDYQRKWNTRPIGVGASPLRTGTSSRQRRGGQE